MNGRKRFIPITRARAYQKRLPSIAPAVPLAITPHKLSGPRAARAPATGMITSEGIGGNTVSRNISRKMPT